jgi:hypothetical protein
MPNLHSGCLVEGTIFRVIAKTAGKKEQKRKKSRIREAVPGAGREEAL